MTTGSTEQIQRSEAVTSSEYRYAPTEEAKKADGGRKLRDLREEIERAEAELVGTLVAIQDKLTFDRMKKEAGEKVREATVEKVKAMAENVSDRGRRAGQTAMETLRRHPVSTAALSLGLTWRPTSRP